MRQECFGHMVCVKYGGRKFEQVIAGGRAVLDIWKEEKACGERIVVCSGY